MHFLPELQMTLAHEKYQATMTPQNRVIRDDTISPHSIAMRASGYAHVRHHGSGCDILRECPHCKKKNSTQYTKNDATFWACPHCDRIEADTRKLDRCLTLTFGKELPEDLFGRFTTDVTYPTLSSQCVRDSILIPMLKSHDHVTVDMDKTYLSNPEREELFAGILRHSDITAEQLKSKLTILYSDIGFLKWTWKYINEQSNRQVALFANA
jgi:hypothetical protein